VALTVAVSALEWLRQLYGFADGWVNLFAIERATGARLTAWAPADQTDLLDGDITGWAGRCCVYFGVATRRQRLAGGQRGRSEDCCYYPGFWLDVDIQSERHRLPNLPADRDTAVKLIQAFPLEPSASVETGNGWHAWWLFAEPASREEMEPLLARWRATWRRLATERNLHVDDVWDLPRVMRLPGTDNKGLMVIGKAYFDRRYSPADIGEQLDPAPPPQRTGRETVATGHLAGSRFNEEVTAGEVLAWAGWQILPERRQPRDGSRHWHHPGSANDISATIYEDGYTCIWSETVAAATGCTVRESLSPWALYTYLFHHGDFTASYHEIQKMGYRNRELPRQMPTVANGQAGPKPKLAVFTYDQIEKRRARFLWEPWLPEGKLVMLDGDSGTGKSTVAGDLIARITTGRPMPDGTGGGDPRNVILLSIEEDPEDTTVWRLEEAGADMSRVTGVRGRINDLGQIEPIGLPTDTDTLAELIRSTNAALLVVDVVMGYLDEHVDTNTDSKVRRALNSLVSLVSTTGTTVLCLRHPRKGGGRALEAGGGSVAFTALSRASWFLGYHPEDPTVRVLAPVVINQRAKPRSLSFRLVQADHGQCTRVVWGEAVDVGADELSNPALISTGDGPAVAEARQFIRALLSPGDEMWVKDFEHEILDVLQVAKSTLKRARQMEGLVAFQERRGVDGSGAKNAWRIRRPREIFDHTECPDFPDISGHTLQPSQLLPPEDQRFNPTPG
jgi:hypothetical protein